jgi:hypothetical protein
VVWEDGGREAPSYPIGEQGRHLITEGGREYRRIVALHPVSRVLGGTILVVSPEGYPPGVDTMQH